MERSISGFTHGEKTVFQTMFDFIELQSMLFSFTLQFHLKTIWPLFSVTQLTGVILLDLLHLHFMDDLRRFSRFAKMHSIDASMDLPLFGQFDVLVVETFEFATNDGRLGWNHPEEESSSRGEGEKCNAYRNRLLSDRAVRDRLHRDRCTSAVNAGIPLWSAREPLVVVLQRTIASEMFFLKQSRCRFARGKQSNRNGFTSDYCSSAAIQAGGISFPSLCSDHVHRIDKQCPDETTETYHVPSPACDSRIESR